VGTEIEENEVATCHFARENWPILDWKMSYDDALSITSDRNECSNWTD